MNRSELYPSMEDITFKVAVAYENLRRGGLHKLNLDNFPNAKRSEIMTKTGISFCKRNDTEFIIYVVLAPYTIRVNGEYYQFDGVPVGNKFTLKYDIVSFTGPPKVLKKTHYYHPFVYDEPLNMICFGGDGRDGRWAREDIDIYWNNWYRATDKTTIHKIAKWLNEGRFILEEGYFGDHRKVKLLSRSNFPSEYRTREAAKTSKIRIVGPP